MQHSVFEWISLCLVTLRQVAVLPNEHKRFLLDLVVFVTFITLDSVLWRYEVAGYNRILFDGIKIKMLITYAWFDNAWFYCRVTLADLALQRIITPRPIYHTNALKPVNNNAYFVLLY